jgi:branched-chain amino acid transport system ATP-binding protein
MTVLVNGGVLTEGTPDEIANNPEVKAVYLGHGEEDGAAGPPQGAGAPSGGRAAPADLGGHSHA